MVARCALIGVLTAYAILGRQHAAVWISDITLWSNANTVGIPTERTRSNLAKALYSEGRIEDALAVVK